MNPGLPLPRVWFLPCCPVQSPSPARTPTITPHTSSVLQRLRRPGGRVHPSYVASTSPSPLQKNVVLGAFEDACVCGVANDDMKRSCAWVRAHLLQRNDDRAKLVSVPAEPEDGANSHRKPGVGKQEYPIGTHRKRAQRQKKHGLNKKMLKQRRAVVLSHFGLCKEDTTTELRVAGWHYHPIVLAAGNEDELVPNVVSLQIANDLLQAGWVAPLPVSPNPIPVYSIPDQLLPLHPPRDTGINSMKRSERLATVSLGDTSLPQTTPCPPWRQTYHRRTQITRRTTQRLILARRACQHRWWCSSRQRLTRWR